MGPKSIVPTGQQQPRKKPGLICRPPSPVKPRSALESQRVERAHPALRVLPGACQPRCPHACTSTRLRSGSGIRARLRAAPSGLCSLGPIPTPTLRVHAYWACGQRVCQDRAPCKPRKAGWALHDTARRAARGFTGAARRQTQPQPAAAKTSPTRRVTQAADPSAS